MLSVFCRKMQILICIFRLFTYLFLLGAFVSLGKEARFVLTKEALELLFMCAELFLTERTVEALVGCDREALGVAAVGDLPLQKKKERSAKQGVRIDVRNEDEGGEHHREIPVVYTTGRAATVLHKPCLEGAEEEDTNDVADREGERDQNKYALIEDAEEVEKAENGVERKPANRDKGGRFPRLVSWLCHSGDRLVIAFELLLTAHTLEP